MAKSIAVESKSGGMKEIRMIDFVKLTGARQWTHDGKMSRNMIEEEILDIVHEMQDMMIAETHTIIGD